MGMYKDAVSCALEDGEIANAINIVNEIQQKEGARELKRSLLIHIAKLQLDRHKATIGSNQQQQSEKRLAQALQEVLNVQDEDETRIIGIEDILQHIDESIKIKEFKDQITASLRTYDNEIVRLREDIKMLCDNSKILKDQIRMLKNKYIDVNAEKQCEECQETLFSDYGYIFPCMHSFHAECLMKKLPKRE